MLTVGEIGGSPAARSFSGTWWSYGGGQTLTGTWRQNTRTNSNVAPVTITFSGPDTALMTLPNGRTTSLKRHRRQNARTNSNAASMTITFSGADTALMTLPNGRTTNLRRHRF